MFSSQMKHLKFGFGLALTASFLTGCGSSSSSSSSNKVDTETPDKPPTIKVPVIKEPKANIDINPNPANFTLANAEKISLAVIDKIYLVENLLNFNAHKSTNHNESLGIFTLDYEQLVESYEQAKSIECTYGENKILINNEDKPNNIQDAKLSFNFNNCELEDTKLDGESLIYAQYDSSNPNKSINTYSLQAKNYFIIASNESGFEPLGILSNGRLDINGDIQAVSQADKNNSTKNLVITANNYSVSTQKNLETEYLPNGNFIVNGKINESCNLTSQNKEVCTTKINFLEYSTSGLGTNNSWITISNANLTSSRDTCIMDYNFNNNLGWDIHCDSERYIQNGNYILHSNTSNADGQITVRLSSLILEDNRYSDNELDEKINDDEVTSQEMLAPYKGKIIIEGQGQAKISLKFTEQLGTNLDIEVTDRSGRIICSSNNNSVSKQDDVKATLKAALTACKH